MLFVPFFESLQGQADHLDEVETLLRRHEIPEETLAEYAEAVARLVFMAAMRGQILDRDPAARLKNAGDLEPTWQSLPFADAEEFFKGKKLLKDWSDYKGTWEEARVYGFKVVGITKKNALKAIHADVLQAVKGNMTVDEFTKKAVDKYGLKGRHAELVVRTNVQTAYSWGHYQQLDAQRDLYELWAFDVVVDNATSDICLPLQGKAYPSNHPIWEHLYPPNHYGCRTTVFPLNRDELKEQGFKEEKSWPKSPITGADYMPQHGFEINVGKHKLLGDVVPDPGDPVVAKAVEEIRNPPPLVYPGFKKRKDAEKWMMDNGLAKVCDYEGVTDPDVIDQFNRSVTDHCTKFPELRKQMNFLGTIQNRNALMVEKIRDEAITELRQKGIPETDIAGAAERIARTRVKIKYRITGRVESRTWAESASAGWEDGAGVSVNSLWAKGKPVYGQTITEALARNVRSKYHPVGCDSIRSIIDHEMGHELDRLLDAANDPEIKRLTTDFLGLGETKAKEALSTYAYTAGVTGRPRKETIAEAWCEYLNNPSPRDLARAIGQRLEKLYHEKYI